jgi:hypothetical protein
MDFLIGVLGVVFAFGVVIFVHEFGHFIVAKKVRGEGGSVFFWAWDRKCLDSNGGKPVTVWPGFPWAVKFVWPVKWNRAGIPRRFGIPGNFTPNLGIDAFPSWWLGRP